MGWTKGHELKYWTKNGIDKGDYIYNQYYKAFKLDKYDLEGKTIADVGCGPFGGVVASHGEANVIPMDVLAKEYNEWKKSPLPIIHGDLSKRLPLESESCDYVICTNAIDHIPDMSHGFKELSRILKKGGTLFLHVHLRTKEQLNKAHVHTLDLEGAEKLVSKQGLKIAESVRDGDWVNDNDHRTAAYIWATK